MMVNDRHMARVFLAQARATPHAGWRATLLAWARRRRVAGRVVRARRAQQLSLFSEGQ
ncbi:hypothetical protein J2W27_000358 [Variovorax boronicumulans]|uniref:hypothetical protein n=1 Tax=Variovorax boronicumulans TaxID=436515 RepID=UPI002786887D|nr:hypothetical protein [Variovorax boronicumulans]MDP9908265.1 hypothetical protein [Variovorax boronicumulans]